MTTEVDNYRGYEIRFNTTNETFECDIENGKAEKKSYGAIKSTIDKFIKENSEFKPFEVECRDGSGIIVTVIGIRADGRFFIKNNSGKTYQISSWDESQYFLPNEANVPIYKRIHDLNCQIRALEDMVSQERENLVLVTLKDVKPKYLSK